MLFKISFQNIRKSLRDYAIYFFTLIIGVSVFYVFNAIEEQSVYLEVSSGTKEIIRLLTSMLSGVSVFVSLVLGFLIVYASRFLMKRRNREFALYLLLGMGKGKLSAILLTETLLIGIGSLAAGLFVGVGLSQVMSALVADLFEANMSSYRFVLSGEAVLKTIVYFGIMYVVVMLFDSVMVSKYKLLDLMQSDRKSEKQRLKNPILCIVVFALAAGMLGYAYYRVGFKPTGLSEKLVPRFILMGAASTFLIFWSVSGLLLHIIASMKRMYFKSLNCFTFRQISSRINTMVCSMTVICLMLFVAICTLSAAFSIRNSMNANLDALCPADAALYYEGYDRDSGNSVSVKGQDGLDIGAMYERYGCDIAENFSEYVQLSVYHSAEFSWADSFGDKAEEIMTQYPFLAYATLEDIVTVSDYNRLMELYGREQLKLGKDEYILLCDFQSMKEVRDIGLAGGAEITVFGHCLQPAYDHCLDGFIQISSQHLNTGIFIVPDETVEGIEPMQSFFIGNYAAESAAEKAAVEEKVRETYGYVAGQAEQADPDSRIRYFLTIDTKMDISEATIGLGALVALLGLYIGLVFLISCGVILALKQLSESIDSQRRYSMLRKIGAEERDISRSLFRQTGLFFLLPLLLACVHSVFGIRFAMVFLEIFGTEKMLESILITSGIILLIYGGYFLITYLCGKSIIREKI